MKRTILSSLAVLMTAAVVRTHAANIIWVTFHSDDNTPSTAAASAGFTNAPDAGYTQLLRDNGHTVTRYLTRDIPEANVLNAADLVIISRSVPSGNYELDAETAAWNGITAPTMILGGYVLRNNRLGFTTGTTIPDVNSNPVRLTVNYPKNPIFAGIALDANRLMVNPYANIVTHTNFTQRGISVNTSPVAGGGTVLATVGTPGDAALGGMIIAEWQKGAIMGTTPADILGGPRLVFLTGSRESSGLTAEGAGIYDLNPDGAQMFLNAVAYMAAGGRGGRSVTVTTTDNENPAAGQTSLLQAITDLQEGDTIRFNISGAGPHMIVTPIGGYPMITANNVTIDGYSQPGSSPNTNSILGGNNAQLRIVLDSTGTDSAPNPDPSFPNRPLRRSTRLDFPMEVGNTGYGETENGILAVYQADNVTIRGLSFIARHTAGDENDPAIYCVALVREATNAHVNGCWFGLPPGGSTMADVKPAASAIAAFRWRIPVDVFSEGLRAGTDGDGVNDRAEFNVCTGSRINFALELPRAKVSGNYVNVFPNGLTFVDIDDIYAQLTAIGGGESVEFLENGRITTDSVIGTDGDGVSDSDERNIVGHSVYDVHVEFYTSATNAVIAGNYFGVGINGTTPAPVSTNAAPNFVAVPGSSTGIRIGSNGDGVSDDLEGNLIVNSPGSTFSGNANVPTVVRRNTLRNNNYQGIPFSAVGTINPPMLTTISNNVLYGMYDGLFGDYTTAFIDLFTADPAALANTNFWPVPLVHSSQHLATFTDNGPQDLDPAVGSFAFDVSSLNLADSTYVAVAITYSTEANASNASTATTGPTSNPISRRPALKIERIADKVYLSWLAKEGTFLVQQQAGTGFDPNMWLELPAPTHTGGRNINEVVFDPFFVQYFYRLISQ
ncbi:MAG: hypothetical protein L0Y58_07835 [Verrucomicrobia subdivision 3 bacterium]|nr:hypothetical protein [Limisphaerales bacterium]